MCVNVWPFKIRPQSLIILLHFHDNWVILMKTPKALYSNMTQSIMWLQMKSVLQIFCLIITAYQVSLFLMASNLWLLQCTWVLSTKMTNEDGWCCKMWGSHLYLSWKDKPTLRLQWSFPLCYCRLIVVKAQVVLKVFRQLWRY